MKIKSIGVSLAISLLALTGAPSSAQTLESAVRDILNARVAQTETAPGYAVNPMVLHQHGNETPHQHRYDHSPQQSYTARYVQSTQLHQHGNAAPHEHAYSDAHAQQLSNERAAEVRQNELQQARQDARREARQDARQAARDKAQAKADARAQAKWNKKQRQAHERDHQRGRAHTHTNY